MLGGPFDGHNARPTGIGAAAPLSQWPGFWCECDTKSSLFDAFRLVNALPADLKEKFDVFKADEAADPLPNGKPCTPVNTDRDAHAGTPVPIGDTDHHDKEIRKGMNPAGKNKEGQPTGLPEQMTHAWIAYVLPKDTSLTAKGRELKGLIEKDEKARWMSPDIPYPYQRWISLVTGRQFTRHTKPSAHKHEIQLMLELPANILKK